MAVFTKVSIDVATDLAQQLGLGSVLSLQGIPSGIENTNYFLTTPRGEYVLTLFERLSQEQLPFYLHLMKHLAEQGIPVPAPQADAQGDILFRVCGKPAAVVSKLRGASQLHPDVHHCKAVGAMLARMHLAAAGFPYQQAHLRGLAWWRETVPTLLSFLNGEQRALIESELRYQSDLAQTVEYRTLPHGPIHADLFRDNVLFDGEQLSGFFDFYFAGCDTFLFDIAVCLNDWCVDAHTGQADAMRTHAFVSAYDAVRPLTPAERQLLPDMLRAAALRFWVSRWWDICFPRAASVLQPHDPAYFERILRERKTSRAY
jgi:homoserine kinase type II